MDNKFYEEYMQHNSELYSSLVKKLTEGGTISDNELAFMLAYRKDLKQSMAVSPLKKVLSGVKEVLNIFNTDDNDIKEDIE